MPGGIQITTIRVFCLIALIIASIIASTSYAQSMGGNRTKNNDAIIAQGLALEIVDALNNSDVEFLTQVLDIESMAHVAARNAVDDKKKIAAIVKGFTLDATKKQIGQDTFSGILDQTFTAKFMRMIDEQGTLCPLIRVDYEDSGYEYMILTVNKARKVSDIFFASRGKTMTDSYTQALQMLISPSDSWFNQLLNRQVIDDNLLNKFNKIGEYRRSGDFQKAYDVIQSFPTEVQQQRIIINIAIEFALTINDEEYMRQLTMLEKHFGDEESTQFMLVDYHFMKEDFKGALATLIKVTNRFGDDGALSLLKATMSFSDGDAKTAEQYVLNGIDMEQDYIGNYWTLADIYNHTKEFDKLVGALEELTVKFGYEFTHESISTSPDFAEFSQSVPYKKWMELN